MVSFYPKSPCSPTPFLWHLIDAAAADVAPVMLASKIRERVAQHSS